MDLDARQHHHLQVDSFLQHQHQHQDLTHPQLLQTGDGLCGVASEQVVEEAEAGEGVVDPIEDPRLQLLDHIPLQVQRCDRPKVAQLTAAKVPEGFDQQLVQER